MGGKNGNDLIRSLQSFKFLNPNHTKSVQQICPKLIGRVNRAIWFFKIQNCKLIFLKHHMNPNHLHGNETNVVNKDSSTGDTIYVLIVEFKLDP